MTKPLLAYSTATLSWGTEDLPRKHQFAENWCFQRNILCLCLAALNHFTWPWKTLCCLGGHHTHTWHCSLNMQSPFMFFFVLCSLCLFFLTVGLVFVFFLGTVWPSTRRLWKGSPVEWGEPQSTVQKSKILEGDGETSRGLWGCCQMLSSGASGKV